MLKWIKAMFAREEPLEVVKPRFVDLPEHPNDGRMRIYDLKGRLLHVAPEPAWKRNFSLTPEQLSARNKKTAATKAKNKARVPATSKGAA